MKGLDPLPEKLPARWHAWWGYFRVFEETKYVKARVSLELAKRNAHRLNVYVEVFGSGRFPFFKREHQEAAYCVRLPLPVVLRIAEWVALGGQRTRYQIGNHKWTERFDDLGDEKPHLHGVAKGFADQLRAARQHLLARNRPAAVQLYNEAIREYKKTQLEELERAQLGPRFRKLYKLLAAAPASKKPKGGAA